MSAHLQRARLLREHHRHEEAVAALVQHLSAQPDDPDAYVELALNRKNMPGQMEAALADITICCGLLPEEGYPLAIRSDILTRLDRCHEALAAANAAIALAPGEEPGWIAKSLAEAGLDDWPASERSAREVLSIDPGNPSGSNLLAQALRFQNRFQESLAESRRRLELDPESAYAHSNLGWTALAHHRGREAEEHFREALRIDPTLKHSRVGLKEAYRMRSLLYRMASRLQKAVFAMPDWLRGRAMVFVIIIGFASISTLEDSGLPGVVLALSLLWYLVATALWWPRALANLVVWLDRMVRPSLERHEIVEAVSVGGSLVAGCLTLGMGAWLHSAPAMICGATLVTAAVPLCVALDPRYRLPGRVAFWIATAVTVATGIVFALGIGVPLDDTTPKGLGEQAAAAMSLLALFSIGWLILANCLKRK
ncbi:MAG: tetratricopeptide repeat protein [Luteolibacter sp.]